MLEQVAADLTQATDREIRVWDVRSFPTAERLAGHGEVHVSFQLAVQHGGTVRHGALLVPLPEAITLGLSLCLVEEREIEEARAWTRLDRTTKEAIVETGRFVAGAVDTILASHVPGASVVLAGCQGVRPDVRPAFPHAPEEPLTAIVSRARIGRYPSFELVCMLPGFLF